MFPITLRLVGRSFSAVVLVFELWSFWVRLRLVPRPGTRGFSSIFLCELSAKLIETSKQKFNFENGDLHLDIGLGIRGNDDDFRPFRLSLSG